MDFGAGLSRPLEGAAAEVVAAMTNRPTPVVAVDIPSGVSGDSGEVLGRDRDIATASGHFGKEIAGPPSKD